MSSHQPAGLYLRCMTHKGQLSSSFYSLTHVTGNKPFDVPLHRAIDIAGSHPVVPTKGSHPFLIPFAACQIINSSPFKFVLKWFWKRTGCATFLLFFLWLRLPLKDHGRYSVTSGSTGTPRCGNSLMRESLVANNG